MLEFEYFLRKSVPRSRIAYMEMDTDSLYFALAGKSLEDCVPPENIGYFNAKKEKFLVIGDENHVSYRTPGLFKVSCCLINNSHDISNHLKFSWNSVAPE